jgi:hypothetical protein
MKKKRFPGFKKCMAMMRKHGGKAEEGFFALLPHVGEYVHHLIEEFNKSENSVCQPWILELLGESKSPDAIDFLAGHLRSPDESLRFWAIWGLHQINTKEARTILWSARSFTFASPEETEQFRSELDTIVAGDFDPGFRE